MVSFQPTPDGEKVIIKTKCPMCRQTTDLEVPLRGFYLWRSGSLIQDALPELTPPQREQLITGMCDPCWKRLFGDSNQQTTAE